VSLPDQEHLDGIVGRLAALTDTVDGVHRVADRAGILRPSDAEPEAAAARDAGLLEDYTAKLYELHGELERARTWVRKELKQLTG
jgi:hypothetical protein